MAIAEELNLDFSDPCTIEEVKQVGQELIHVHVEQVVALPSLVVVRKGSVSSSCSPAFRITPFLEVLFSAFAMSLLIDSVLHSHLLVRSDLV